MTLNWSQIQTYEELKAFASERCDSTTPEENWAIMERMRQIKYNYKPGELKFIPIMQQIATNPDGTEFVSERWLRLKDGRVLHWKKPTESAQAVIEKYYPEEAIAYRRCQTES